VAILDADKEGFLRSETSLMQTIGRAARNVNAKVILYADKVTEAMQRTIEETARRRHLQEEYNREHDITPETIRKAIHAGIEAEAAAHAEANARVGRTDDAEYITEEYIAELEAEMYAAAEAMEFERAATIRDRISGLRDQVGKPMAAVQERDGAASTKRRGAKKKTGDPERWKGRVPRPKRNL
jgi:excinuclease ABC subunit B